MQLERVQPNVITYNAMIAACKSSWPRALQLLEHMQRKAIEPNATTYSAAISACEKGQQAEAVAALTLAGAGPAGPA